MEFYDLVGNFRINGVKKYLISMGYGLLIPHFGPTKWPKMEFLNNNHLRNAGKMTKCMH